MPVTLEFQTIENCTEDLETFFKSVERNFVHYLKREGFIGNDLCEDVLNPRPMLRKIDIAGELVQAISNAVKLDKDKFHTLLNHLKESGVLYERIVKILTEEFSKLAGYPPGRGSQPTQGHYQQKEDAAPIAAIENSSPTAEDRNIVPTLTSTDGPIGSALFPFSSQRRPHTPPPGQSSSTTGHFPLLDPLESLSLKPLALASPNMHIHLQPQQETKFPVTEGVPPSLKPYIGAKGGGDSKPDIRKCPYLKDILMHGDTKIDCPYLQDVLLPQIEREKRVCSYLKDILLDDTEKEDPQLPGTIPMLQREIQKLKSNLSNEEERREAAEKLNKKLFQRLEMLKRCLQEISTLVKDKHKLKLELEKWSSPCNKQPQPLYPQPDQIGESTNICELEKEIERLKKEIQQLKEQLRRVRTSKLMALQCSDHRSSTHPILSQPVSKNLEGEEDTSKSNQQPTETFAFVGLHN